MTRGETMRKARVDAGYSLRGLANEAGVSFMTLHRAECDLHDTSLIVVELLADALGLSIDEYVGHEVIRHG